MQFPVMTDIVLSFFYDWTSSITGSSQTPIARVGRQNITDALQALYLGSSRGHCPLVTASSPRLTHGFGQCFSRTVLQEVPQARNTCCVVRAVSCDRFNVLVNNQNLTAKMLALSGVSTCRNWLQALRRCYLLLNLHLLKRQWLFKVCMFPGMIDGAGLVVRRVGTLIPVLRAGVIHGINCSIWLT
jgi:hypothetical protein